MKLSVLLTAVLLFGSSQASCVPAIADPKVAEVIGRSKTTTRTYAVYNWNRVIRPGGTTLLEWSAEFHSGNLHRVETPRDRAIANCETMTGTYLDLTTGRTASGPVVARVACGISTQTPFIDQGWLGVANTPFGAVDRIRVTDNELVRTYEVSRDGVILRTIFNGRGAGLPLALADIAIACTSSVPEDIFTEASLQQSFVPERYKVSPEPVPDMSGSLSPVVTGPAQPGNANCRSESP